MKKKMTFREFLDLEQDTDIYNDYDEQPGIAVCGPVLLTEEGEKRYADLMDLNVKLIDYCSAVVSVYDQRDDSWKRKRDLLNEFAWSAAGYIDDELYQKLFREE